MYSTEDIRHAWLSACLSVWSETIRDIDPGQPDERGWIDQMWRRLGAVDPDGPDWGSYIDSHGEEGYDEAPESWCGAGPAWAGVRRLGRHLEDDQCVDAQLRPDLACRILPGTGRLGDESRWEDIGLDFSALSPEYSGPSAYDALAPGTLVTVGDGWAGSHIVLVDEVDDEDETFSTVEANGRGELGDGRYGEGWVRRRDVGEIEDYQGQTHTVRPRGFDEIALVFPPQKTWFTGAAVKGGS